MGIPGLYDHIKQIARVVSLHEVSAMEGFIAQRREKGCIVVGIDACLWIQRILHGQNMHHVHKGSNAEVKELLRRLAKLLNFAIVPLFVFDGPERPKLKRGKRVVHSPGWLVGIFKELIDAFGFYHLDARGEAEAELAALNYRKLIDLVITDDGDAVIFGTCILARNLDLKKELPSLTIYSRNRITEELGMSPGGLLLFALLVGGDYDQTGLMGCGGAIAAGLARTSLGDDLREAFHSLSPADFVEFCQAWRVDLARELKTNTSGMLPSRQPGLAKKIPATFPNYTVVKLYAASLITESLTDANFVPRAPDLGTIMDIYARYIHPTLEAKVELLHDDIIPGYYFKALQLGMYFPNDFLTVNKQLSDPAASRGFTIAQLTLRKSRVTEITLFACLSSATYRQYTVNVPAPLVSHVLPSLMAGRNHTSTTYERVLPILRTSAQPLVGARHQQHRVADNNGDDDDDDNDNDGGGDHRDNTNEDEDSDGDEADNEEDMDGDSEVGFDEDGDQSDGDESGAEEEADNGMSDIEVIEASGNGRGLMREWRSGAVEVIDVSDDERGQDNGDIDVMAGKQRGGGIIEVIDISDEERERNDSQVIDISDEERERNDSQVIDISDEERERNDGATEVIDISDDEREHGNSGTTMGTTVFNQWSGEDIEVIDISDDERGGRTIEAMDISDSEQQSDSDIEML